MIGLGDGRYLDLVGLGAYVILMIPIGVVLLVARDRARRWMR